MSHHQDMKPLRLADFAKMRAAGERIASLTCYDSSFAALLDRAGIDLILVGDSMGNVLQGHSSTLPVTLVCPWGQPVAHFLAPPPPKTPGRAIAYFSEHGEDASHAELVEGLLAELARMRAQIDGKRSSTQSVPGRPSGEGDAAEDDDSESEEEWGSDDDS